MPELGRAASGFLIHGRNGRQLARGFHRAQGESDNPCDQLASEGKRHLWEFRREPGPLAMHAALRPGSKGPKLPRMNLDSLKLVCFAVKEEAKFFNALASGHQNIRIVLTGIGPNNAEREMRRLLQEIQPRLVVSAGFAGGLRPSLSSGTVLFSKSQDAALEQALAKAGAKPAQFHFAKHVATRSEEKKHLHQKAGADAVDMESQVIAAVCREHGIPSVTVRVVLDTAEEDLPFDFNQFLSKDERLDMAKLALAIVKHPGKIPSLLRLRQQSDTAARRLSEVLGRVLLT